MKVNETRPVTALSESALSNSSTVPVCTTGTVASESLLLLAYTHITESAPSRLRGACAVSVACQSRSLLSSSSSSRLHPSSALTAPGQISAES